MGANKKHLTIVQMVEEFQCPGCVNGHEPKSCQAFNLIENQGCTGSRCTNHSPGTNMLGLGRIALGLPKGFNRYGLFPGKSDSIADAIDGQMIVRLWDKQVPKYNHYNIPVWRLERNGFLFVRAFHPRLNASAVDVVQLGNNKVEEIAGQALDAGKFFEEYD